MNRRDIEDARLAGILDDAKAAELTAFLKSRADPGASSDDESLRFLANFNDIFISVGIVILSIGLIMVSSTLFLATESAILIIAPVIIALWLMLEYFAGRRRLLLPSMTLTVMITFLFTLLTALVANGLGSVDSATSRFDGGFGNGIDTIKGVALWSAGGATIAAGTIYARFRLPFALFLIAVALAAGLYFEAFTNGNVSPIYSGSASFLIGLATLAVAVFFDARDPARQTLNADNAFWLHLAAAPQIMLGLRAIFSGGTFSSLSGAEAVPLLIALVVFSILSLALNRRAIIAAGLLSFWVAFNALADGATSGVLQITLPLLLLGGGIVLLGAGWKTARRFVLAFVPKTGIFARIFPPEPA